MTDQALVELAILARENAYVPYSGFKVGAALLTRQGVCYTGCNVENAAYTPTCCAERTAFVKAVSEGEREFSKIAVAGWRDGDKPGFAFPCGVCRQVMIEFCEPDEFIIITSAGYDDYKVMTLADLLPNGFSGSNIM